MQLINWLLISYLILRLLPIELTQIAQELKKTWSQYLRPALAVFHHMLIKIFVLISSYHLYHPLIMLQVTYVRSATL